MEQKDAPKPKLADFKGRPPLIEVTRTAQDEADVSATKAMLELYTHEDGFHCPRCSFTTKSPEDAVNHLAEEINKAFAHLGGLSSP